MQDNTRNEPGRLSGGLIRMLKHARVAWYRDVHGTTAYYEHPLPNVPGGVFVNGRKLTDLVVDREGRYADFPSPGVQHLLRERGITLESGWECQRETSGLEINVAVRQSHYRAVRHQNGQVSAQCIGDCAVILVDGMRRWTIKIAIAYRAFAEMGISPREGWYPVQENLLKRP